MNSLRRATTSLITINDGFDTNRPRQSLSISLSDIIKLARRIQEAFEVDNFGYQALDGAAMPTLYDKFETDNLDVECFWSSVPIDSIAMARRLCVGRGFSPL